MHCISVTACDECYTPLAWEYRNITRPFSLIYYIKGGSAFYTIDGTERPFVKNHLYILPANKPLSLREDSNDKLYLLYIHAFTSPEVERVIDVDVGADPFVFRTLGIIREYIGEHGGIHVKHLTDMLLSYIGETMQDGTASLPSRIKEYIDGHFVEVFKGNDLSHHFNYSQSHLSRVFKQRYGLTPKQYAKERLLGRIVELIALGHSVADIAERLDFSSPENLSRFFKDFYGCSPTEYRRLLKSVSVTPK